MIVICYLVWKVSLCVILFQSYNYYIVPTMGEGVVQSQLVVSRTLVTCQDCQDCTFTPYMCNCEI